MMKISRVIAKTFSNLEFKNISRMGENINTERVILTTLNQILREVLKRTK
jgi:hypothetical protein